MRYAAIQNGVVLRIVVQDVQPPNVPHKGLTFLPVVEVRPATLDAATEKMTGPVVTVNTTQVTETYSKVNLTAGELDALKDNQVSSVDKLIGAILFDVVNDVRVLKGQAVITKAQFLAYAKTKVGTF